LPVVEVEPRAEVSETRANVHVNLRQRKFFAHAAHGSVGVSPTRTVPIGETTWDSTMPGHSAGLLRLCIIATPVGDAVDRALDAFFQTIAGRLPHEATRAWQSTEEPAPSFAQLHQSDVAIICARRMPLGGEALARVRWYCERGRPLIALCAGSSPAFERWPRFDCDVLGIESAGTVGARPGPAPVSPRVPSHPILAGTGAFGSAKGLPQGLDLADDTEVLLEFHGDGTLQPAAWTRSRGSARVFATSLGRPADLAEPAFAGLMYNAIQWVTRSSRLV
jgi:hypothetical protein